jgi:hypothetical protein
MTAWGWRRRPTTADCRLLTTSDTSDGRADHAHANNNAVILRGAKRSRRIHSHQGTPYSLVTIRS